MKFAIQFHGYRKGGFNEIEYPILMEVDADHPAAAVLKLYNTHAIKSVTSIDIIEEQCVREKATCDHIVGEMEHPDGCINSVTVRELAERKGERMLYPYTYCPDCGAKLDFEQENS